MDTQRLEGSRFVTWQLYGLAAGGSRERPLASQLYRLRLDRRTEEEQRWAKGCPGLFAGAAC